MNRNRRNIIASIFGFGALAKAQSAVGVGGYGQQPKMYTEQEAFPHGHEEYKPLPVQGSGRGVVAFSGHEGPEWQGGKALNNQCPVCGKMAPPAKKKKEGTYVCSVVVNAKEGGETGEFECPIGVLARCSRCNAAFWQDAEVIK